MQENSISYSQKDRDLFGKIKLNNTNKITFYIQNIYSNSEEIPANDAGYSITLFDDPKGKERTLTNSVADVTVILIMKLYMKNRYSNMIKYYGTDGLCCICNVQSGTFHSVNASEIFQKVANEYPYEFLSQKEQEFSEYETYGIQW